MQREPRQCKNCKKEFTIEPEDFDFYEKISVPPPTWCPECRFIRRFTWRSERPSHRRKCALCEKETLSTYALDAPYIIYCPSCWWSDGWDPGEYWADYDFSRTFFDQLHDLHRRVPLPALWGFKNENCDYANYIGSSKNCYFSFSTIWCEDACYSTSIDRSRSCVDCDSVVNSEYCYENLVGEQNSNSVYLDHCIQCLDSSFLYDCVGCQNCFMSNNLRNKKYVFRNKQLSKDMYLEKVKGVNTGDVKSLVGLKDELKELKEKSLHKYSNILKSTNSNGDDIYGSKNVHHSFRIQSSENVRYSWRLIELKDAYDISGAIKSELVYDASVAADRNYASKFYYQCRNCKNVEYALFAEASSNLFGCVGLRKKEYCILNKSYPREEYEKLVARIKTQMGANPYIDRKGRRYAYGEFFPPELSPFAYNETIAQEYFPLTKEEAIENGYLWRDPEERNYQIQIPNDKLPDHIKDVPEDIVDKIIGCAHEGTCNEQCTTAFKIIPQELQFYRKTNLPLPRLCPNCRHYQRLKQRNPIKLWRRKCTCAGEKSENSVYANTIKHFHDSGHCPNEFETSYAPDRPEIVYCEQCYNAEVV